MAANRRLVSALSVLLLGLAAGCSGSEGAGGGGGNADGQVAGDAQTDVDDSATAAADAAGDAASGGGSVDGQGGGGGGDVDAGGCGADCDAMGAGGDDAGSTDDAGTGPDGGDAAGNADGAGAGNADGAGAGDAASPDAGGPADAGGPDNSCVVDTAKGPQGDECPTGQQCVVGVGKCSGLAVGQCVKTIDTCPAVNAPVCDCTGKTWPSLCDAQAGGAVVAKGGACAGPPAKKCGTIAGIGCGTGEVCDLGCGTDAEGVCVGEPPAVCPPGGAAECGCDGNTWPSACARINAGVAFAYAGACKTGPQEVACKLGPVKPVLCPDNFYCLIDVAGDCSGKGHCKPMPVVCDEADKPVCGCDMNTYKNACKLQQAGFSQLSAEACPN